MGVGHGAQSLRLGKSLFSSWVTVGMRELEDKEIHADLQFQFLPLPTR
jgi:hypothetical protein